MRWKVLFDEECPLCCKFSNIIKNMDKNNEFELESYQIYSTYNETPGIEELAKEIHIINDSDDTKKGAAAVTAILSILPGLKPFRWMIESRWGRKGTKIFYTGLEKFRRCRNCR